MCGRHRARDPGRLIADRCLVTISELSQQLEESGFGGGDVSGQTQ
jgi:hypothetical protein